MKKLLLIILFLLGYYGVFCLSEMLFLQMDIQWENRAKQAGYYEQLPDSMKR